MKDLDKLNKAVGEVVESDCTLDELAFLWGVNYAITYAMGYDSKSYGLSDGIAKKLDKILIK